APLAGLTADEFVTRILVGRFGISGAVIGFNFHFGKNGAGSPDFLTAEGRKVGFGVDVIAPFELNGRPVSSGPMRDALAAGRPEEAATLLGFPWFISGEVIHGDKRGRDLGFPTANINLDAAFWFSEWPSVSRPPISTSMRLADCGTASTRCASPSAIASTTVSPISAAGRCSTQ